MPKLETRYIGSRADFLANPDAKESGEDEDVGFRPGNCKKLDVQVVIEVGSHNP